MRSFCVKVRGEDITDRRWMMNARRITILLYFEVDNPAPPFI